MMLIIKSMEKSSPTFVGFFVSGMNIKFPNNKRRKYE
tara:strand:+ start:27 stop:137 length:111 start_codon:yes stop_codon:yes gene_type:complete